MKQVITPVWALALALALVSGAAAAQGLKIGVVNLTRVVLESPQANEARTNLKDKFADRRQELHDMLKALKQDIQRLKRDSAVMSEKAREELKDAIHDQRRQLQLARSEYKYDLRQARKDEMKKVQKAIADVIRQYAEEHNYDLILAQGILYATKTVNITDGVLQLLEARN